MWTFFDGIMKETASKLPVSFRQLLEVNEQRRRSTVSSKNVSNLQLTTMDEQIV